MIKAPRVLILLCLLVLGPGQVGCSRIRGGNANLDSQLSACANTLAETFGTVSEETLASSNLGSALSQFQAVRSRDSIGTYTAIQFRDYSGPVQISLTGWPSTSQIQSGAESDYAVQARCIAVQNGACFRLAVLVGYLGGSVAAGSEVTGAILQADNSSATHFSQACTSQTNSIDGPASPYN